MNVQHFFTCTLLTTYIIQIILSLESSIYELRDQTKGSAYDKESGYGMSCYDVS